MAAALVIVVTTLSGEVIRFPGSPTVTRDTHGRPVCWTGPDASGDIVTVYVQGVSSLRTLTHED